MGSLQLLHANLISRIISSAIISPMMARLHARVVLEVPWQTGKNNSFDLQVVQK